VNEKYQFGWTPLHDACNSGHTATAIALLENGAVGVNDGSNDGVTPSYYACMSCTADVVLLLIQHGAILTAADLQRFRDQPTVTEENAYTVEAAYK
jgi:ankyrin repeat protein